jgi:hypothetical protein
MVECNGVLVERDGMIGDELSALVDRLRWDRRRHPYRGRREYSQTAREVAHVADQLITAGAARQVVPDLRKSVDRITRALMYVDDSSGMVGDDLHEIMALYARACALAPPAPKSLASWLVKLACYGPGWPRIQLREFAAALGEGGISELERLVEQRARTVDPQSWAGGFAVRDLREQLAEVSGDLDRYVAVLAEHLATAIQYERITLALRAADRRAEAIDWARRGLAAKPGWPHADQLRDTLVDMLLEEGSTEAALAARRAEFQRHPTATAYHHLADTAAKIQADDPTPWAMELLNDRVATQPVYASELVSVLRAAGAYEQAWQVGVTHRDRLSERQWLTLLEQRGTTHPAEVVEPYQDLIERHILNSTDKHRYRRAVALLPALRTAHAAAGDRAAFHAYLADLRLRHKRRPTFLKTLDAEVDLRTPA